MSFVSATATPPRVSLDRDAHIAPAVVSHAWMRANGAAVRVIDSRHSDDFAAAHVLGSTSLPLDALLVDDTSEASLLRLGSAVQRALAARGISPDDHIVAVDDGGSSAALAALLSELAGVTKVSVLLGGVGSLLVDGPVGSGPAQVRTDTSAAWRDVALDLTRCATFGDLDHAATTGNARILDVRSQLEHEGIVGPPCCAERGSIPNALHTEWTTLLDLSGAPRLASEVRAMLAKLGIEPADDIVITCHAGHRAAAAARVLRASGFAHVRVSIGSWHEWSARTAAERAGQHGH